MNISTGGPHILLFERDQQLAVLLTSEFQLAGYESHTARTAVEVFDAIARYPIKIVLVNVAQAAAARREFWVALDTQRRGRGVQVLTFRCMNIAGYGPYDAEDRSQAMVDSEVDGMLGIMNLVDTVRTRIPGNGIKTTTGTMPRMPRMTTPPPATQMPPGPARTVAPPLSPSLSSPFVNGPLSRPSLTDNMQLPSRPMPVMQPPPPSISVVPPGPPPIVEVQPVQPAAQSEITMSSNPSTYTDKIRAVLYPNQRVWTPQGSGTTSTMPESRPTYESIASSVSTPPAATGEATTLQRLASGQIGMENPQESGLAQLSRMIQERQSQQPGRDSSLRNNYPPQPVTEPTTEPPTLAASNGMMGTMNNGIAATVNTNPVNYAPSTLATSNGMMGTTNGTAITVNTNPVNYAPPAARPMPVSDNIAISAQPLRASPIQDIPAERPLSGQTHTESVRRSETLARPTYGPPSAAPMAIPPLASIATPPAPTPVKVVPSTPPPAPPTIPAQPARSAKEEVAYIAEEPEEQTLHQIDGELISNEKAKSRPAFKETVLDAAPKAADEEVEAVSSMSPNNEILLNIMQSLPPMPPPQAQPPQVQILNGRATRTLGSVLLEGHLVPENRLEVAQHIQRMLRGVDLNYQLGEILLMFKLLTPDQLLAASLVSYGLITTSQISSLGRIRQELHSIGLEYDLENLLILFRILTPEQLREVRSSWQG